MAFETKKKGIQMKQPVKEMEVDGESSASEGGFLADEYSESEVMLNPENDENPEDMNEEMLHSQEDVDMDDALEDAATTRSTDQADGKPKSEKKPPSRTEKRTQLIDRKKNKEHFMTVLDAKKIWELLRQRKVDAAEKVKLVGQILDLFKGKLVEVRNVRLYFVR